MKKINKIIKNSLSNKLIVLGVIPFLLISFWVIASLMFNNKISFSVLLYKQSSNDIKIVTSETLLKGEKITGEFKAKENYLGLIILRFNKYVKHDFNSEDVLVFRLKEKGNRKWYHINNYRSGLLENNLLFPFGFSIINNSKNKIYQFEIESLLGNETNAARVNKKDLNLLTGYQFPKNEITSSKKSALKFLVKKTFTSLINIDFLLSSLVYLLPFIIYVFIYILSPWWKKNKNLRHTILIFTFFLILFDIFFIKEFYLGVLLTLIIIWIYFILKNKLNSKINFILVFILILLWSLLILLKINDFQNKINIWTYALLVIGLAQAILEEKGVLKDK